MENLLDCSYSALTTGISLQFKGLDDSALSSNPLKMINIAIVLCKQIQRQYEVQLKMLAMMMRLGVNDLLKMTKTRG